MKVLRVYLFQLRVRKLTLLRGVRGASLPVVDRLSPNTSHVVRY